MIKAKINVHECESQNQLKEMILLDLTTIQIFEFVHYTKYPHGF